jgi:hypothetical protein
MQTAAGTASRFAAFIPLPGRTWKNIHAFSEREEARLLFSCGPQRT